jgi:hypothetical protein
VVVCDGETSIEVPVTVPMPLIESEVVSATDQDSVVLPPLPKGQTDPGEAAKEAMVGAAALMPASGT